MILPLLEVSSARAAGATPNVPPPRFRPLGRVAHVHLNSREYVRSQGVTEAQKAGLRYEADTQRHLHSLFADYMSGPVLTLLDNNVYRSLRPDGLLKFEDRAFIFEIKHHHCPEAWWQLEKLYKVALEHVFHCPLSLVEICRTYDPATLFPCEVTLIPDLVEWCSEPRPDFGVFTWRK